MIVHNFLPQNLASISIKHVILGGGKPSPDMRKVRIPPLTRISILVNRGIKFSENYDRRTDCVSALMHFLMSGPDPVNHPNYITRKLCRLSMFGCKINTMVVGTLLCKKSQTINNLWNRLNLFGFQLNFPPFC